MNEAERDVIDDDIDAVIEVSSPPGGAAELAAGSAGPLVSNSVNGSDMVLGPEKITPEIIIFLIHVWCRIIFSSLAYSFR